MTEKPRKRSRVDNPELQRRVRNVQEWMLKGEPVSDMVVSMVSTWDISERQAYRYIKEAYATFKEDNSGKINSRKAFHLAARQKLLKEVLKNGKTDVQMALKILQDMGKVEGVYAPQKVDHTTKGEKIESSKAVIQLSNGTILSLD